MFAQIVVAFFGVRASRKPVFTQPGFDVVVVVVVVVVVLLLLLLLLLLLPLLCLLLVLRILILILATTPIALPIRPSPAGERASS